MVKFSTSIEYAVHALVYLARSRPGSSVLLADLARAISVPESYLRKVFQLLSKRGLVVTRRGAKGGVALARQPGRITLRDVVEAIDGSLPLWNCLRAHRGCRVATPCPVKSVFAEAARSMAEVLEASTIAGLSEQLGSKALRWLPVGECA